MTILTALEVGASLPIGKVRKLRPGAGHQPACGCKQRLGIQVELVSKLGSGPSLAVTLGKLPGY